MDKRSEQMYINVTSTCTEDPVATGTNPVAAMIDTQPVLLLHNWRI